MNARNRSGIAFIALALTLNSCGGCSSINGVIDTNTVQRAAQFIDRITVMPEGGLVADPHPIADRMILIEFLWPVDRASISMSQFTITALNRTMTIRELAFDLPTDQDHVGRCTRIFLDLDDDVFDPAITAPMPVVLTWDAASVRVLPSIYAGPPPSPPSEPIQFAFVLSPAGPSGTAARISHFGVPFEPSPPQPGWGRPVELSDLEALGGTDALDRVGRSFELGSALTQRVRPHAPLEFRFDRPISVAVITVSPEDSAGVSFASNGPGLLFPFTTASSRTTAGMLPDTVYTVTLLSRDWRMSLPISMGTQDETGNFLIPRYSDALISAALAQGLSMRGLASDVDFTFRTSPARIDAPAHLATVGPSALSSSRLVTTAQWAVDATSSAPSTVLVEVFNPSGVVVASTNASVSGWTSRTLTRGSLSRAVLERALIASPAFPNGTEATFRVRTTFRDAIGTFLGDDEVDVRVDLVAPAITASDVTVTNNTGADERLDKVCVSTPRDIAAISVSVTDGASATFNVTPEMCSANPADSSRWICCLNGVQLGYRPGVDEEAAVLEVRVTDSAGNRSAPVTVTSIPTCLQPPRRDLLVGGGIERPLVGVRPGTDRADVFFTQGTRVMRALWGGTTWTNATVWSLPDGERFGELMDLTYQSGRPVLCVQHGVRVAPIDDEIDQGQTTLFRARVDDPRVESDWDRVEVGPSLLTGCRVVMGTGVNAGPIVAYASKNPAASGWQASKPTITFMRTSGAISTELIPLRGAGTARDLTLDFDTVTGKVVAAWRQSAQRQGWGLIQYSERNTNGTWQEPTYPNGSSYLNGASPEVKYTNGVLWLAFVTHTFDFIVVERRSGSAWLAVDHVQSQRRLGKRGGDPLNGLYLGPAYDLQRDPEGNIWLAHGGGEGKEGEVTLTRYQPNGARATDVLDTVGKNVAMRLAVGPGGHRRVLWDERRDKSGSSRVALTFHDDASGVILSRSATLGPLFGCAGNWVTSRSITTAQFSLSFPPDGEKLVPNDDVLGLDGGVDGGKGFGFLGEPFALGVELPATLTSGTSRTIETFASKDTLFDEVFDGLSFKQGRVPLRYQSSVCVPDHESAPRSMDICDVQRTGETLNTFAAGTPAWVRASLRPSTSTGATQFVAPTVVGTWTSLPGASVCSGRLDFLYRAGPTDFQCMRCPDPDGDADTIEPSGRVFFHPLLNACVTCDGTSEAAVPRPITNQTVMTCESCGTNTGLDAGDMGWDVLPGDRQCFHCAKGSVPRTCSTDNDCGETWSCGSLPGLDLPRVDDRVCVDAICANDAECAPGSLCVNNRCTTSGGGITPSRRSTTRTAQCTPIGCVSCFNQVACLGDGDCPANHHCMNQADAGFSPAEPDPSSTAAFATPICLPRSVGQNNIRAALLANNPETEPVKKLVKDFNLLLTDGSLPVNMDQPDVSISGVRLRFRGMTVTNSPDADGQGRVRLRVGITEGSRITGTWLSGGVFFEAVLDDEPSVWIDLQPYSFGGELHFSAIESGFDGEIDVSLPQCTGWCSLKRALFDFIAHALMVLIEGAGLFDPEALVDTSGLGHSAKLFDLVVPQLFEKSLVRAMFVRPFVPSQTLQFQERNVPSNDPRFWGDLVELPRFDQNGLRLQIRDGR